MPHAHDGLTYFLVHRARKDGFLCLFSFSDSWVSEEVVTVRMEPIESLLQKIIGQYNKQPEGWNVFSDQKGNILVLGPENGYKLKLVSINPLEYIGVGTEIEALSETRKKISGNHSYGFRPLPDKAVQELFRSRHRGYIQKNRIERLLALKPMSFQDLRERKEKAVLGGPVISHPNLSMISEGQRELEKKLVTAADKLFRAKHPNRASIYG